MYEVIMNNDNFEKHFEYIFNFNEDKFYLIIRNKKFEYKNNIKEFGHGNVKFSMDINFINDDNYGISFQSFSGKKYIIFQFETEEEAFYFKMKYC